METRTTLRPGDRGTRKLVERYGKRLVCVRYRYDPVTQRRYTTVELIVAEAVWQYSHHVLPGLLTHRGPILTVANWSGQRPDGALVRAARERSGGNPLFLCELIALVLARDGRVSLEALRGVGIPAVLQQLLERRLEHVSEQTAARLGRAAVLGDPFSLAELST